jgi:hypothetical protein
MLAYSGKAQPYLDAIAEGVFTSQDVRDWLIAGTPMERNYTGAGVLIDEQRAVRCRTKADQTAILGELLVRPRHPLQLSYRRQQRA